MILRLDECHVDGLGGWSFDTAGVLTQITSSSSLQPLLLKIHRTHTHMRISTGNHGGHVCNLFQSAQKFGVSEVDERSLFSFSSFIILYFYFFEVRSNPSPSISRMMHGATRTSILCQSNVSIAFKTFYVVS